MRRDATLRDVTVEFGKGASEPSESFRRLERKGKTD